MPMEWNDSGKPGGKKKRTKEKKTKEAAMN
jgi:hypothetical protein